jgi:hypothetical protein
MKYFPSEFDDRLATGPNPDRAFLLEAGATGNEPAIISLGQCVSHYTTPEYDTNYTTAFSIRQIIRSACTCRAADVLPSTYASEMGLKPLIATENRC